MESRNLKLIKIKIKMNKNKNKNKNGHLLEIVLSKKHGGEMKRLGGNEGEKHMWKINR